MWRGEDTDELKRLNEEYCAMFGDYPWGYMEVEYGVDEYEEYIADIKKAIRVGRELPDIVD